MKGFELWVGRRGGDRGASGHHSSRSMSSLGDRSCHGRRRCYRVTSQIQTHTRHANSTPLRHYYSLNDGIGTLGDDVKSLWTLNSPGWRSGGRVFGGPWGGSKNPLPGRHCKSMKLGVVVVGQLLSTNSVDVENAFSPTSQSVDFRDMCSATVTIRLRSFSAIVRRLNY